MQQGTDISFIMVLIHNQYTCVKQVYVVYVQGTLYPSISLLEIGREIVSVRTLPLSNCRHKNSTIIRIVIYRGLVHDKFCLMLSDR
jgi:hypothetical protein